MRPILAWLFVVVASLSSALAADKAAGTPLGAGEYLLVFETEGDLKPLTVTVRKDAAGALSITSPAAPLSPPAVFQRGSMFQFTLLKVTPRDPSANMPGDRFEGFIFVGDMTPFEGENFYRGTFALVGTETVGSSSKGVSKGQFILYPLPAKP